jgi:solute carrier family 34 (sodium-dependent phosphate cotransporter)
VHTLFNVTAIALVYPVRRVRDLPVRLATRFAEVASTRRTLVVVYILGLFIVIPLLGVFVLE